jgi:hypothetical protein
MYDLKPDAPAEFRGEFRPTATNVPGIRIGEHLPHQARLMDKISVVRSVTHTNAGHGMGTHWMMTGYVPTIEINDNLNPAAGSVVARLRGANAPQLPACGHTPGHCVVRLASCGDRLTFAGDALFAVSFDHPEWYNGFEHDPEESARVRVRLLRELAAKREPLVATHLSFPSVCHVAVAGDAFRCVPATWEH